MGMLARIKRVLAGLALVAVPVQAVAQSGGTTTPGAYPPGTSSSGGTGIAPTAPPALGSGTPTTPAPATGSPGTAIPSLPDWDPYSSDPLNTTPATPTPQPAITPDPFLPGQSPLAQQMRFLQQVRFEYTLLGRNGDLGQNQLELFGTFVFPFAYQVAPLEVTPGFAVQLWDGPDGTTALTDPDLPGQTYSAYLDIGWRPQLTTNLSAELGIRPGVYSDFDHVSSDSLRIKGRGLGLYRYNPQWQIVAGVIYLDRFDVKILPAGGAIWTPTPDVRWEILFPQPKLAQRLTTWGNTEWWWYIGGEYGGDGWTVRRANGASDAFDYDDLRLIGGLEFRPVGSLGGLQGQIELGYIFDRKLKYVSGLRYKAKDTIMLRVMFMR